MITFLHRKPETTTGDLRIPVTFWEYEPQEGLDPGEVKKIERYSCFAEAYSPSMKDLTILDTKGTKEAVTIRIRDPGREYIPCNKHFVELHDYRYEGKTFGIKDARPDTTQNRFVTIVLEASV